MRTIATVAVSALALTCCEPTPEGWTARHDDPEATSPDQRFVELPDGIEVSYGDNATLWHSEHTARGNFRYSARVTHLDSGLHPHGAGLTVGGTDVLGAAQSYTYFLVRGDGLFLIKTRSGDETSEILPWTDHAALQWEDADGVTTNELAIEAAGDKVRFEINGQVVHEMERAKIMADGLCGLRLVHDIHVRFDRLAIEAKP